MRIFNPLILIEFKAALFIIKQTSDELVYTSMRGVEEIFEQIKTKIQRLIFAFDLYVFIIYNDSEMHF